MRSLLAAILIASFCQPTFAEISVSVKKAKAVVTVESTETTQVQTEDGDGIGKPKVLSLDPQVREGKPVAILIVKTDRPIDELLIKPKSKTCKPLQISPGVFYVNESGTHFVEVNVIGQNPLTWDYETVTLTVGKDPNPPPGPDPDQPAPIDLPGLRVLIVYESADVSRLTIGQIEILRGKKMADFLNANCVKDGWRVLDKDAKFTNPDHHWAKALKRDRTALPWIIVSNGKTGFEGPLTETADQAIELIEKYKVAE